VTEDEFSPAQFLSIRHKDTSLHDLQQGLENLTGTIKDHKMQLKQLVLQHFDQFLKCKDCIDNLHYGVRDGGTGQDHIERLKEKIDDLKSSGEVLYRPLLVAKRDTDRIRSGLNVTRRFRFLFEIPASIKRNIQENDYEKVIKDYRKAKQLISKSEREVYRRVWEEVLALIAGLRGQLISTMSSEASRPWQDHLAAIKCLVQLDCPKNPVVKYMIAQQQDIERLLDMGYCDFKTRVELAVGRVLPKRVPAGAVLQTGDEDARKPMQLQLFEEIGPRAVAELGVECLQNLSKTMSERVTALCDAGANLRPQSVLYEASKVARSSAGGFHGEVDAGSEPPYSLGSDDEGGSGTWEMYATLTAAPISDRERRAKQQLGQLLRSVVNVYCSRCNLVLGEREDWWPREFVLAIRRCHGDLRQCCVKHGIVWRHLRSIEKLDEVVVWRYAQMRWASAVEQVSAMVHTPCFLAAAGLSQASPWSRTGRPRVPDDEGARSFVSLASTLDGDRYSAGIMDTVAMLDGILRSGSKDLDLICGVESAASREELARRMWSYIFDACARFADCIHYVAFDVGLRMADLDGSARHLPHDPIDELTSIGEPATGVSLLALLCLLEKVAQHTVPTLIMYTNKAIVESHTLITEKNVTMEVAADDGFAESDDYDDGHSNKSGGSGDIEAESDQGPHGLGDPGNPRDDRDAVELLSQLSAMLLAKYTGKQAKILRNLVCEGVSQAGVAWEHWGRPTEIRDYVMNVLLHCVGMHSELAVSVPGRLHCAVACALETITGEAATDTLPLCRSSACETLGLTFVGAAKFREEVELISGSISTHGAEQLNLELNFIMSVLEEYETEVSTGRAKMCRALLAKLWLPTNSNGASDEKQRKPQDGFEHICRETFAATELMFLCFRAQQRAEKNNLDVAERVHVAARGSRQNELHAALVAPKPRLQTLHV
jgi:hypothetical protein